MIYNWYDQVLPPEMCIGYFTVSLTSVSLFLFLRCSVCMKTLSSWYFEKLGLLYCKDDYWSKFAESCNNCSLLITGPVMVSPICIIPQQLFLTLSLVSQSSHSH
jgi:hypothetical protein